MTMYLVNIALLIIWAIVLFQKEASPANKKIFVTIASLQWIFLSGLRHISIGADTNNYSNLFNGVQYQSWNQLFKNFYNILFLGAYGKDPGYEIFEKFVQLFTINYQIYLVIIAIIFTVPLGIWIYKNSSEPLISFLIYSCLFYSFFAITGHRQTIATGLVVLIGYKFIKERKFWPFLVLVLVAFTIHKSAVSFFPFYFIANKKITKRYLIIIATIIPVLFIFKYQIMSVLGIFMRYEGFIAQYQGAGTWTFTAVLLMITVVTIWRRKVMLKNNSQVTHYINALIMAFAFVPLTFVNPSAMRVVQYFSLFIMLLIPEIIRSFPKRERVIVYYVAATLLIVLFAKNNPQYLFFWQG